MIEPMPSQATIIRAWLEIQTQPRTVVEIAEAIGKPRDAQVYRNVCRMFRDGMVSREGRCRRYRFTLQRDAMIRPRMPRDEYLRRAREADRKRRHRRGGQSQATWRAEQARRHAATIARREAEKAKRRAEREAERERREAEREAEQTQRRQDRNAARAQRRAERERDVWQAPRSRVVRAPKPPRPKPAPQPRKVRERVHVAPAPAPVVYQSVDDFIANGGKVERLEPGACSKPLKRIGKPGVFTITRREAA